MGYTRKIISLVGIAIANSVINDWNHERLIKDILAYQENLELKLPASQSKILQQHNTEISPEQLKKEQHKSLNVNELTPFILHNLINRKE